MTAIVPPASSPSPSDPGRPTDTQDRVELAPGAVPAGGRFVNDDLLPVPLAERSRTTAGRWGSRSRCCCTPC